MRLSGEQDCIIFKPHPTRFSQDWDRYASPYAFALDQKQIQHRMPGDLSGHALWRNPYAGNFQAGYALQEGLLKDGWEVATRDDLANRFKQVVAVAANPHFLSYAIYRRDADGTFSYKDMKGPPINHTRYGAPIRDPEELAKNFGEQFLGYYKMPDMGISALIFN